MADGVRRPAQEPGQRFRLPVVVTKLNPPRMQAQRIRRERLLGQLAAGEEQTLTIVEAPAGFGKTTILSEYQARLAARGELVAWLSLDPEDDDPHHFLNALIAAIAENAQHIVPGTIAILNKDHLVSNRVILHELINELHDSARTITIIIDDFHQIRSPDVHELVSYLLMHAPAMLRVIIGTRTAESLPLANLRARGQLTELTTRDLRFNMQDTREFFDSRALGSLDAIDVQSLFRATDGWAAGLQIAAIALRTGTPAKYVAHSLAGMARNVWDYFDQCVLTRAPPEIETFLLRTSVLERLSPALCEAVAGVTDGPRLLGWMVSQNMFVDALDETGDWFRVHPLFLGFLRHRLQQTSPGMLCELHERASGWFAEHGLWPEAIRHALAADQVEQAARWTEHCAMQEIEDGSLRSVLAWSSRLPEHVLAERPSLKMATAWALALTFQLEKARRMLGEIEQAAGTDAGPIVGAAQIAALRLAIAAMADDSVSLQRWGPYCAATLGGQDRYSDQIIRNTLIHGNLRAGRLAEARAADRLPAHYSETSRSIFATVYGTCLVAQCMIEQGELHLAAQRLEETLEMSHARVGRHSAAASLTASFLAAVHYERDELETAEELIADRLDLIEEACFVDAVQSAHLTLARLNADRGLFDAAQLFIARADGIAGKRDWTRLRAACGAERVHLHLRRGHLAEARRRLSELAAQVGPEPVDPGRTTNGDAWQCLSVASARVELASGRPDAAMRALDSATAYATASQNRYAEAKLHLLRAMALFAAGRLEPAMQALEAALAVGASAGMIRTFLDEGPICAELIERFARRCMTSPSVPADYLTRLLRALRRDEISRPASRPARSVPPAEQLSQREQILLRLVADGMSNKQIAKQLSITPETVKWHLKNVFAKLDVSSRLQAVRKASEVGLLTEELRRAS